MVPNKAVKGVAPGPATLVASAVAEGIFMTNISRFLIRPWLYFFGGGNPNKRHNRKEILFKGWDGKTQMIHKIVCVCVCVSAHALSLV